MRSRFLLAAIALLWLSTSIALADHGGPHQKDCVGNPPRQIEDPLGPPCVPFYEGPNPGSTYVGVTKDEVRFVLYNDFGIDADLNAPWRPTDESRTEVAKANLVRTFKAHLRYFQRRMQTYGRTARVHAVSSSGHTCLGRTADAHRILALHEPLGALVFARDASCFVRQMASEGRFTFSFEPSTRAALDHSAPYAHAFLPEPELQAITSAGYVCRSLAGRRASFSTDPALLGERRSFGLLTPRERSTQQRWGTLLRREARRQCGLRMDARAIVDMSSAAEAASGAIIAMARFKLRGITTVLCACPPVPDSQVISVLQRVATASAYRPEWFFDSTSGMDIALWHRRNGTPGQVSFGASSLWRQPAFREQYHYQAYLTEEPSSSPNPLYSFQSYHTLLMVFQALQAAGDAPDARTIPMAMATMNYTDPTNSFTPVGGFGMHGPRAVGPWSFVDTGLAWWWDPSGTGPGGDAGEGCIRVAQRGRRYHVDEWPSGDSHLFWTGDPCTGPTVEDFSTPL